MLYSRRQMLRLLAVGAGAMLLPAPLRPRAESSSGAVFATPPTLMLHTKDRWKLEKIMGWLNQNGYTSINYQMLGKAIRGEGSLPEKPIIISIDDIGSHYIQPYFLAMADIVEQAGHIGVFSVVTREPVDRTPDIWKNLRALAARGWEMDSHTNRHVSLPRIKDDTELRDEILDSFKRIEDGIGVRPWALVPPYGNVYSAHRERIFDQRIFDATAEAGASFVVGIVGGRSFDPKQSSPYYVGRIGPGVDHIQTGWYVEHFDKLG